ncbi:MAG: AIR synthase related protein [Thermofilaceae archaeon]
MEKEFVSQLLRRLGEEDNDVSYVGEWAFKIDGSSASTSKLPFQTWGDFGWRNVAAAYSDMRVKYVDSAYMLVSVTAPSIDVAKEVVEGVVEASRRLPVKYLGGDLNQGGEVVVDVALVGRAPVRLGRRPRPGDLLITIPEFGYTSIAYKYWREAHPAARRGVDALRRPTPLWPLPPLNCVTASMDSSDGLADVLWTMARGVDIHITALPTTAEVLDFASERGLDVEELVFNGGEEFLPVFAVRRGCEVESPYVVFAEVVEGTGRVFWRGQELRWRGWSYFK